MDHSCSRKMDHLFKEDRPFLFKENAPLLFKENGPLLFKILKKVIKHVSRMKAKMAIENNRLKSIVTLSVKILNKKSSYIIEVPGSLFYKQEP
ncbi:hypothetical protein CEXT_317361 [Caerostris extrusa]|uniref:Uncharacterized protein n=1 Tax=Caerostris extrusa TaxID=172846 RepID=A0AAV4PGC9_CAEEX|nr:hypothetical protein CEXT_317361 [Caerostris extrusa]